MSTGKKIRNSFLLILAAAIWGFAFAFQSMGGKALGTFTMNAFRSFIGVAAMLPVIRFFYGNLKPNRETLIGGILCGIVLCFACNLQQAGLLYTSPGKAGFITASYMILVAFISLFTAKKPGLITFVSVLFGVIGLFLICIPSGEDLSVNRGDLLCIGCAVGYALQILIIDWAGEKAEAVKMCAIQFFIVGVVSAVLMALFENPTLEALEEGWIPLLYVGVLSTAGAYSLQMIGMNGLNPAVSSLIMSLESVFSVIGEFVIFGTTLEGKALLGCGIIFAAILLSQIDTFRKKDPVQMQSER